MHFGFALELSDIDLWNIDLLDTHLDLLDTDIPSKYFACLHNVFKTSSRHVFKTSSRHVFKTSSRHAFKTSWRRLQRKTSCEVLKTSSRRLQDVLEDIKLLRWRRVWWRFWVLILMDLYFTATRFIRDMSSPSG